MKTGGYNPAWGVWINHSPELGFVQ